MRTNAILLIAASLAASPARANMVISLVPGPTLSSSPAALDAFHRAAASWEALFVDPILVKIEADLGTFGDPRIIGSASTSLEAGSHNLIRNSMVSDSAGYSTLGIAEAIPRADQFSYTMPTGFSYSGQIVLATANAKALGLIPSDPLGAADGAITFNSAFSFDYDRSDGVGSGLTDFETVAAHEIGHVLGFLSWVDEINGGTPGAYPITPLDLFRFSSGTSPKNLAQFTADPRQLIPGQSAMFSDSIFRYDMATGYPDQASHWLDNPNQSNYIGLMDPVLSSGMYETATAADVRAFDLIGYDLAVPEPGTAVLLVAGILVGIRLSRSRRA